MNYKVSTLPIFDKQAKRLSKKYASLKKELAQLMNDLEENPELGIAIGKGFYKIRLAIASKGRGKSGGARVVTYVKVIESTVYLIAIYDKSDQSTITDSVLDELFKLIP